MSLEGTCSTSYMFIMGQSISHHIALVSKYFLKMSQATNIVKPAEPDLKKVLCDPLVSCCPDIPIHTWPQDFRRMMVFPHLGYLINRFQ